MRQVPGVPVREWDLDAAQEMFRVQLVLVAGEEEEEECRRVVRVSRSNSRR